MLEALERGESLILFPEGTRGSGRAVGRFQSGVGCGPHGVFAASGLSPHP